MSAPTHHDSIRFGSNTPQNDCSWVLNSSIRASSRKNRVYLFREFLLETFPTLIRDEKHRTILDVAGGKGDLSWLLLNLDQIQCVVVDPRTPNHQHLHRSILYLKEHPNVLAERAVPDSPTHHPLAGLVHKLHPPYQQPNHFRLHVDHDLVEALRVYVNFKDRNVWIEYWKMAQQKAARKAQQVGMDSIPPEDSSTIIDPFKALNILLDTKLIVGFHPDQATGACIDLALLLDISYCVVPCCVFPSEFKDRLTPQGTPVRTYTELIAFLQTKDPIHMKTAELKFYGTHTARNIVLYRVHRVPP